MKLFLAIVCMTVRESPPSRGAWIEIIRYLSIAIILLSRPPRGGRGLKSSACRTARKLLAVAPLAGGVD